MRGCVLVSLGLLRDKLLSEDSGLAAGPRDSLLDVLVVALATPSVDCSDREEESPFLARRLDEPSLAVAAVSSFLARRLGEPSLAVAAVSSFLARRLDGPSLVAGATEGLVSKEEVSVDFNCEVELL